MCCVAVSPKSAEAMPALGGDRQVDGFSILTSCLGRAGVWQHRHNPDDPAAAGGEMHLPTKPCHQAVPHLDWSAADGEGTNKIGAFQAKTDK